MAGSAICRALQEKGYGDEAKGGALLTPTRQELDLLNHEAVKDWYATNKPDVVVLAAAKVGGIYANDTYPADFLLENLKIQTNVIEGAWKAGVRRFLFLGSSCIYPKFAEQPIKEEALLTGSLEPTNEWYAIAKITGIKLCESLRKQYGFDAISLMPTNLYGPGDNYDLETSHVLPALLRKFHEAKLSGAKEVVLWGSGTPLREFLHCDDLADALVFLLKHYSEYEHINVGSGSEVTIRGLAETIAKVVGYDAELVFDATKPDGTPRKLMDSGRLHALGWNDARSLEDGIATTYAHWLEIQD